MAIKDQYDWSLTFRKAIGKERSIMMQRVHITLPPEEYEWVTGLAKNEDRSISAQFSRIIRSAKRVKEEEIVKLGNQTSLE